MNLENRIKAVEKLGAYLASKPEALQAIVHQAYIKNNWFLQEYQYNAIQAYAQLMSSESLHAWLDPYQISDNHIPRTIALVLAGNIPLVGLHDILSVILSGHIAQIKLSSQDLQLTPFVLQKLIELSPELNPYIKIVQRQQNFDAVIATGSDNSARYFEYYFSKYPNIIRKNRTSVALLEGKETSTELQALAQDVALYFGLGCRNVTKLYIPKGYDLRILIDAFETFGNHRDHHKYFNNYEDNGFLLFTENESLFPPIATVYYEYYQDKDQVLNKLNLLEEKVQCIVGKEHIPFGNAQQPAWNDYADGVDTIAFLKQIA
jgi:hypothetical protein